MEAACAIREVEASSPTRNMRSLPRRDAGGGAGQDGGTGGRSAGAEPQKQISRYGVYKCISGGTGQEWSRWLMEGMTKVVAGHSRITKWRWGLSHRRPYEQESGSRARLCEQADCGSEDESKAGRGAGSGMGESQDHRLACDRALFRIRCDLRPEEFLDRVRSRDEGRTADESR